MSVEDKIRKAEEIYYRRRGNEIPVEETVKKTKKNIKLFKKLIKPIIWCVIVYGIFYLIVNSNYIFSKDFTNKAREILSQDINIMEIYSNIKNQVNSFWQNNEKVEEIQSEPQEVQEQKNESQSTEPIIENQGQQVEQTTQDIQNNNENIGGAEEIISTEPVQLSQIEQDANYIKSTISFIKPVTGRISSVYGVRNPTTSTVPKNHTGTDIAAEIGTKIVSATDGTVILSSSQGDYGKHLKIQINDVIIVYAHCNKLYVREGDVIKQGQEIAEVGSSGNTTGPHLHFEVRYQDRYVNPQMILDL